MTSAVSIKPVPEGFSAHTERNATILLPTQDKPFLNPIQEYNRDLSVAVIKHWGTIKEKALKSKWDAKQARRVKRNQGIDQKTEPNGSAPSASIQAETASSSVDAQDQAVPQNATKCAETFYPPKFTIVEALSATGLRSIRYAQEIPGAGLILANDLLPTACESIVRNVEYNDVQAIPHDTLPDGVTPNPEHVAKGKPRRRFKRGGVVVNQGDANTLLYSHRDEADRVDVVDLDPYGTAAPFIDSAVQAVSDGGLLCVTCTDLAVLAGTSYPEKCFANYGGVPVKAEYSHEGALRLVLAAISSTAARYGKTIQPLVSLSIDFYLRVFVRVHSGQAAVKHTFSKHGVVYVCHSCQSHHAHAFGKVVEKTNSKGNSMDSFKFNSGPPVGEKCPECESSMTSCGPLWLGALHDKQFIETLLEDIEGERQNYGTFARMKGMLTMAKEEVHALFYFTPSKVASFFHSVCPNLAEFVSALLNGGFEVSRSHAVPGSIKTNAPNQFVHDIFRTWIEQNPVREDKIPPGSPALKLLKKAKRYDVNFAPHPDLSKVVDKGKLVRYQVNPTKNWGPGSRPKNAPALPDNDVVTQEAFEGAGSKGDDNIGTADASELGKKRPGDGNQARGREKRMRTDDEEEAAQNA